MAAERRRGGWLALLLVVLAGAVAYQFRAPSEPRGPSSGRDGGVARGDSAGRTGELAGIPDVRLEQLDRQAPAAIGINRNPFRFQPRTPPQSQYAPTLPGGSDSLVQVPQGPPPVPPIPLKFIGVVEARGQAGKLAVLSDPRGVYFGREGEVIEGRYRIVRIGVESVEMVYLDGRGRRIIPLSGS
jgi:hypothetical protein